MKQRDRGQVACVGDQHPAPSTQHPAAGIPGTWGFGQEIGAEMMAWGLKRDTAGPGRSQPKAHASLTMVLVSLDGADGDPEGQSNCGCLGAALGPCPAPLAPCPTPLAGSSS